jgi:predicted amidohydrolase
VKRLIGVLLFSVGLCAQPLAIVIRGARVVDGTGAPARLATVVIRGTKIEAVAADAAVPAGACVIDAAGQTLMPGLFDLHRQTVKIPFASLRRRAANAGSWDAKDGRSLFFELGGSAGSSVWMELDNVKFY